MALHDVNEIHDGSQASASELLPSALQFLRMAWYRRNTLLLVGVVISLLGILYVSTATRLFQSEAGILILQSGNDEFVASIGAPMSNQDVMPTYQQLLKSNVVLQNSIDYIPAEHQIEFEGIPEDKWAKELEKNLLVSAVSKTKLIAVKYRAKDPVVAAEVLKAVIKSYLDFIEKTHKGSTSDALEVLTRERAEVEVTLASKTKQLLEAHQLAGNYGLNSNGNVAHSAVQTAVALNEALIEAQKERLEHEATLRAIQTSASKGEDLQQHLLAVEETIGRQVLMSGLGLNAADARTQADLEKKLLADRAEAQTLSQHFGPAHPKLAEVHDRIRANEQYLLAYRNRLGNPMAHLQSQRLGPMLMQMVQQAVNRARQKESNLRAAFELARQEAVVHEGNIAKLEILDHDIQRLQGLHDILVQQIASTNLRQEQGDIRVTIVKEPRPVQQAVWPRIPVVMGLCLFASVVLGSLIVYVQDILDDRFRSPEELNTRIGVQVLAVVGELESATGDGVGAVQSHATPNTVETEAFRTLRTSLAFSDHETARLVISSSEPGDGKTTVLANLAVTYAQSGRRTLLIDADMRRPGMTSLLNLKGRSGLSDLLHSNEDIVAMANRHILHTASPGLDVLPAGPRRPNPAELLATPRMADLLAWADGVYDQILIDAPPVLATSDALVIGRLVDGAILVVRPDKNRRRLVTRSVAAFSGMGIDVLGVVANSVQADNANGYGFNYEYSYGYGHDEQDELEDLQETVVPMETAFDTPIDFGIATNDHVATESPFEAAPLITPRRAA